MSEALKVAIREAVREQGDLKRAVDKIVAEKRRAIISRRRTPSLCQAKRLLGIWMHHEPRPLYPETRATDRILIEQKWVTPSGPLWRMLNGELRSTFCISEDGWEALRRFFGKMEKTP